MDEAGARGAAAQISTGISKMPWSRTTARCRIYPKDRHVAACAVAGEASLIVTSNIKDFDKLPDGIEAITPDAFLLRLLEETPSATASGACGTIGLASADRRWIFLLFSIFCASWRPVSCVGISFEGHVI